MIQSALWHDTVLDAIGAAVQAGGGVKRVACHVWPALDPSSAASRLRAALSPEHPQKLDPEEMILIGKLARATGDNSIMEFMGRELTNEVKPLVAAEAKKRARKQKISWHLSEASRLAQEEE